MTQLNPKLITALMGKLNIMMDRTQDPKFLRTLASIKDLILKTENGKKKEPFLIAMRYIEKLPSSEKPSLFFSAASIGERLGKSKANYTLTSDLLKETDKEIINFQISKLPRLKPTATQEKLLAGLQVNLMKIFKKPIAWSYNFPIDPQSQQVMNDTVGHWQNSLMHQLESKTDEAIKDFTRGFTINNKGGNQYMSQDSTTPDITKIKSDIDKLLSSSKDPANNNLYKKYICNLGGQSNTSIATDLFLNGYFNTNSNEQLLTLGVKVINANWEMEDGRPVLTCQYHINGVHNLAKNTLLYRGLDGKTREADDLEALANQTKNMADVATEQPPLMNISFKVELEVEKNQVKPKIIALDTISYSNRLQSPGLSEEQTLTDTPKLGR